MSWHTKKPNISDQAQRTGEVGLALEIAQEAHALAPQNSTVLQALGRSHLVNQQFPQAQESYRALIEQQPQSANLYYQLGLAQAGAGDNESAMAS